MSASVWNPNAGTIVLSNLNRLSQEFTATAGQTNFVLVITPYTVGAQNLEVFKNGEKLLPSLVTELVGGTSFSIAACTTGDKIEAVVFPATSASFEALAAEAQVASASAAASAASAAASAASISQFTGAALGSNLTFIGAGNRIVGDFSNATVANRVMFQTSTVNGNSYIGAVPNGSGTEVGWESGNYPYVVRVNGAERFRIAADGEVTTVSPAVTFNGFRPFTFTPSLGNAAIQGDSGAWTVGYKFTGSSGAALGGFGALGSANALTNYWIGASYASPTLKIDVLNTLHVASGGGLGYGTGAGGTVTQSTSKSTAVTLNKPCGEVTMYATAGAAGDIAAGATREFLINNSTFGGYDSVVLTGKAYSANYRIEGANSTTGVIGVRVTNITGGTLNQAIVINFAIFKGATS